MTNASLGSGCHGVRAGGRQHQVQPLGGRGGVHASGDPPIEYKDDEHGDGHAGDRPTSASNECQDGDVKNLSEQQQEMLTREIKDEDIDCDFEFLSTVESKNYQREFKRLYKMMISEMKQVQEHVKLDKCSFRYISYTHPPPYQEQLFVDGWRSAQITGGFSNCFPLVSDLFLTTPAVLYHHPLRQLPTSYGLGGWETN